MNRRMPVLFVGHGSPLNAIANNRYTQSLNKLGSSLPRPDAILVISAHWRSNGTWVTAMERPKTIHDFFGFPEALFKIQYPAPGAPMLSKTLVESVEITKVQEDRAQWGLDHGTWSVLRHMYPDAEIPVLQMSMDVNASPDVRMQIGSELAKLRTQGVLILGSGNVVHNLRKIEWGPEAKPLDWASEFNEWVKNSLKVRDLDALKTGWQQLASGRLSLPTAEHFDPLLYILGASGNKDELKVEFDEIQNASISMLTVSFS
ncbi:MAG: 4,5-DOPA dioxygenase extradiol [Bdellovibrionales bacterium]|nr:4,5-DOPA dioxygenase extradiol [Bdellovibrionales bacterium]